MSDRPAYPVVIVGAGLAGLTAATALRARGIAARVYDKGRGVGGRMSIRRRDGHVFDHGAQFFKARDERFMRAVETWCAADVAAEWRGRILRIDGREVWTSDDVRSALAASRSRGSAIDLERGSSQLRLEVRF